MASRSEEAHDGRCEVGTYVGRTGAETRPAAVPGAVLLTGFLGGAVASHVRVGDPLFSHALFPTYVGALLWAGLVLRDDRLQALFVRKGALR